jgi:hypothetical protein
MSLPYCAVPRRACRRLRAVEQPRTHARSRDDASSQAALKKQEDEAAKKKQEDEAAKKKAADDAKKKAAKDAAKKTQV